MFANGGSSANASHLVNDFVKSVRVPGRPRMRVFCLSDTVSQYRCKRGDFF